MGSHVQVRKVLLLPQRNQIRQVVVAVGFVLFAVVDRLVHDVDEEILDFLRHHPDFVELHGEGENRVQQEHEVHEGCRLHNLPTHLADFRLVFGERLCIRVENAARHNVRSVLGANLPAIKRFASLFRQLVVDVLRKATKDLFNQREQRFDLTLRNQLSVTTNFLFLTHTTRRERRRYLGTLFFPFFAAQHKRIATEDWLRIFIALITFW